ncbi:hypothetical protein FKW77_000672 [Venturia effusa]|uniref:Calcineurin-like phosphoesterase domain-containing protein n=1 Tax=Venturia effusa TaxID=50376 RepID=A0A517L2L5_9PEZI|nr:hypothetical protein FKW77_000672 [Venturia effusa]
MDYFEEGTYDGVDPALQKLLVGLKDRFGETSLKMNSLRSDLLSFFNPDEIDLPSNRLGTFRISILGAKERSADALAGQYLADYRVVLEQSPQRKQVTLKIVRQAMTAATDLGIPKSFPRCDGIEDLPDLFSHTSELMDPEPRLHGDVEPSTLDGKEMPWAIRSAVRAIGKSDRTDYSGKAMLAPFRLLALGDPQLEGDTSLPSAPEYQFPGLHQLGRWLRSGRPFLVLDGLQSGLHDIAIDIVRRVKSIRKQIDLVGNDYYLAHQYRALHWYTEPTHVTVLGDLLGSQWIGDEEFGRRSTRFWNRVFKGASLVPKGLLKEYATPTFVRAKWQTDDDESKYEREKTVEVLGASPEWTNRIINVAGNHDIGYAGDINESRVSRFKKQFGPLNGDIHFTLPLQQCSLSHPPASPPTLRLIVLNTMNLDSPVLETNLQQTTYKFINSLIETSSPVGDQTTATILLTHIPLHKEEGTCVDAPLFTYFSEDEGGGIKEQNMISKDMSKSAILHGIFGKNLDPFAPANGMGRDGIILTGHDHEGCDVYHYGFKNNTEWYAKRWRSKEAKEAMADGDVPGIREVTVRSMMGEFGGHAGLLSAWWDFEKRKWQIEVGGCDLGIQHWWWAVHIIDFITIITFVVTVVTWFIEQKMDPYFVQRLWKRAKEKVREEQGRMSGPGRWLA